MEEERKAEKETEEWKRLQEIKRRRSCVKLVPFTWTRCIVESIVVGQIYHHKIKI